MSDRVQGRTGAGAYRRRGAERESCCGKSMPAGKQGDAGAGEELSSRCKLDGVYGLGSGRRASGQEIDGETRSRSVVVRRRWLGEWRRRRWWTGISGLMTGMGRREWTPGFLVGFTAEQRRRKSTEMLGL